MFPQVPRGETVAAYDSYEAALKAVDQLARNEGFTVQDISIVGSDLKSVERVTGRMSMARAAGNGAMSGIMLGLFVGAVFVILDPNLNLPAMFGMLILAIVFGALWGLLVYAISRNKREFTSVMQVTASRYEVIVPPNVAASARQILGQAGGMHVTPPAQTTQAPHPGQAWSPSQASPTSQTWPPAAGGAHIASAEPGAPGESAGSAEPAAPATPPKTYGEMQDEQRRRAREEAARKQQ